MVIKFYYDVEEHKNIELRSEEVQEVMGEIPSWIIRSGISLLFIIVIALVIGSCFFRYPDVISTQMTLTSHEPVAPLVARTSGKICKLYVEDGEIVHSKRLLIVLENPAITDDVLLLEQELQRFLYTPDSLIWHLLKEKELMLGDIQNTYTDLLSNLHAYQNYKTLNYYPQKIKALKNQLKKNHKYYQVILRQRKIVLDQYRLAEQQYNRDSLLYAQQVISAYEHEPIYPKIPGRHSGGPGYRRGTRQSADRAGAPAPGPSERRAGLHSPASVRHGHDGAQLCRRGNCPGGEAAQGVRRRPGGGAGLYRPGRGQGPESCRVHRPVHEGRVYLGGAHLPGAAGQRQPQFEGAVPHL